MTLRPALTLVPSLVVGAALFMGCTSTPPGAPNPAAPAPTPSASFPPGTKTVSTFAGSGAQGAADGAGPAASFNNPNGIAIDASGNVYVSDSGNNKIRKITPSGTVTTLAGSGNAGYVDGAGTQAQFNNINALTADASGNVYVAVGNPGAIRKIAPNGVVSTVASASTSATSQPWYPAGITTASDGNLYYTDYAYHNVNRLNPTTGAIALIAGPPAAVPAASGSADGTGSAARFYNPTNVVADASGNLYVNDFGNYRVRKVVIGTGAVTTLAGSTQGVAVNNVVGAPITNQNDGTGTNAKFNGLWSLGIDPSGTLWTGDGWFLRSINPTTAAVSTYAGNMWGFADGPAPVAQFATVYGIAFDAQGAMYVVDQNNNRIRVIK